MDSVKVSDWAIRYGGRKHVCLLDTRAKAHIFIELVILRCDSIKRLTRDS